MQGNTDGMTRDRVLGLCLRALDAELGLDALGAEFPQGEPSDEYLALVYEDLVDGVEHLPATLLGKTDYSSWRSSEMYSALRLHVLLLRSDLGYRDLTRIYRYVRERDPLAVETLPQLVAEARATLVVRPLDG